MNTKKVTPEEASIEMGVCPKCHHESLEFVEAGDHQMVLCTHCGFEARRFEYPQPHWKEN